MLGQAHEIELPTERQTAGECAKALLSTILFHRLFGSMIPQTSDVLGVTYPRTSNVEAEVLITEKSRELARILRTGDISTIVVEFYERKSKKNTWFAKTYDTCWESWRLNFPVLMNPHSQHATTKHLQQALLDVVANMDSHKDHIPPITTTDATPFPYKISVLEST